MAHVTVRRFCACAFSLVLLLSLAAARAAFAAGPGFAPQTRVGYTSGDQWEPAIAADGYGHVYILYPQYVTVPGCASCPLPKMILVVSNDNGASWETPRQIAPSISGQFDAQIVVDPADHIVMLRLRPDDFEFLAGTSQRLPVTRQIQRLPDPLGD